MDAHVNSVAVEGFGALELVGPGGELQATVVPELAMLGCSLTHRGEELLGQRGGVRGYADRGSTMGIPLLYPWANRLSDLVQAGVAVSADSPLLRIDGPTGLPIHGLNLRHAPWRIERAEGEPDGAVVEASLDLAAAPGLLRAFPYPHTIEVRYRLGAEGLTVTTDVRPTGDVVVPISFGFHPYIAPPGVPRADWTLQARLAEHLELDDRMIPTGRRTPAPSIDGPLGDREFDDGYLAAEPRTLALSTGGRRIEVVLGPRFPFAQVFAPLDQDLIAFEPMTAPTDALVSGGRDLPHVEPGDVFSAEFSVKVR